jgi:N-acyl-D-aspartate/D-glutamate deacylase
MKFIRPYLVVLAVGLGLHARSVLGADYDLVIAKGRVVDGTGAPWFRADVGIRGDRIAAVGDLSASSADRRIDVGGQIVAPGFIDMLGQSELSLLVDNRAESKVRQGITTEVTGEGQSVSPMNDTWVVEAKPWLEKYRLTIEWTDLAGYWQRLREARPAINLATFVGAAQVRGVILGLGDVQPTPEQLARMESRVEDAMRQGALGVSSALIYPPGSYAKNNLSATVPEWAQAGGTEEMIGRFHHPAQRRRILREVRAGLKREPPEGIQLASCVNPALRRYMGRRLDDAAREMKKPPEEALLDLVEADRAQVQVVRFLMSEQDVRLAMRQTWVSFDCDASGQATDGPFAEDLTHPRAFGTMPRVLGKYVRDERLLSLEDAIRKMTSLPALRVRLLDRGLLRPGMAADVVVFDAHKIRDLATFEAPLQYSEGVSYVVVNGRTVLDDGKMTHERPGRPLLQARP